MVKAITQNMNEKDELEILRNRMLEPDELFILGYLKGFNRKATQEWKDNGLWDFSIDLEEY